MKHTPQEPAIAELLTQFDTEIDRLRRKFHGVLKKYEENRLEHFKKVISQMKSL